MILGLFVARLVAEIFGVTVMLFVLQCVFAAAIRKNNFIYNSINRKHLSG